MVVVTSTDEIFDLTQSGKAFFFSKKKRVHSHGLRNILPHIYRIADGGTYGEGHGHHGLISHNGGGHRRLVDENRRLTVASHDHV